MDFIVCLQEGLKRKSTLDYFSLPFKRNQEHLTLSDKKKLTSHMMYYIKTIENREPDKAEAEMGAHVRDATQALFKHYVFGF
jgi:hypothetical protein